MSESATPAEASRALTRTAWTRNIPAPLRTFLQTEVSGAFFLLVATIAALVWAKSPWGSSYESLWSTELSLRLGNIGLEGDLHYWVNDGLMAFFFFVVGLEVRREFDMGELRDRRRAAVPALAALGGMLVPVVIYLAFTSSSTRQAAGGWSWPPTRPSPSACSRWWVAAAHPGCEPSFSRSRLPTTSESCW